MTPNKNPKNGMTPSKNPKKDHEMNDFDKPSERAQHLIVVRESAEYDRLLMEGMIEQTLEKARSVPGATELKEIGIDLIDHPDRYGARMVRSGRTRAVICTRGDVVFLYSMGSATSRDAKGDNAFVELLCDVINRYRPVEMWAASMTRLIRSPMFAGSLM